MKSYYQDRENLELLIQLTKLGEKICVQTSLVSKVPRFHTFMRGVELYKVGYSLVKTNFPSLIPAPLSERERVIPEISEFCPPQSLFHLGGEKSQFIFAKSV